MGPHHKKRSVRVGVYKLNTPFFHSHACFVFLSPARWGDRWAGDREQLTRKLNMGKPGDSFKGQSSVVHQQHQQQHQQPPVFSRALSQKASRSSSFPDRDEAEELWDLDLYGAPTFSPGLAS